MASTDKEPLLRKVPSALNVPPMIIQPGVEKLNSPVTIPDDAVFPVPNFTNFRFDARKRRMPQCISHRGYKAVYPENTMRAFKGAIEVGTHALETDVHVTKDEVVALSHDATLKRCYGREDKIKDRTWDEIKDLRTTKEPHSPMPKLQELLEYLAEPGMEEIWVLLDIKLDNDAETIMRLLGSTIAAAAPSSKRAWNERIILGIWAAKYLPLAMKYLPGFPITHIGFSTSYARHFFSVPNVSFNILLPILIAPGGKRFLRDARETYKRQVFGWTVNDRDKMEWCIRRKLDGVVTDDPKKFLSVCDKVDEYETERWMPITWKHYLDALRVWIWVSIMKIFFRKMFRPVASRALIQRKEGA